MQQAVAAARRFYGPQLSAGEEVVSVHHATAGGTGTRIVFGAIVGALGGWLYAIYLDAALLAPLVLGALIGEMVGYFLAERAARHPDGPGTIHLALILTSQRLLTVGRYAARKRRVLRSYPLAEITGGVTERYPIAHFHLQEITLADGAGPTFVVEGVLDLTP